MSSGLPSQHVYRTSSMTWPIRAWTLTTHPMTFGMHGLPKAVCRSGGSPISNRDWQATKNEGGPRVYVVSSARWTWDAAISNRTAHWQADRANDALERVQSYQVYINLKHNCLKVFPLLLILRAGSPCFAIMIHERPPGWSCAIHRNLPRCRYGEIKNLLTRIALQKMQGWWLVYARFISQRVYSVLLVWKPVETSTYQGCWLDNSPVDQVKLPSEVPSQLNRNSYYESRLMKYIDRKMRPCCAESRLRLDAHIKSIHMVEQLYRDLLQGVALGAANL